MMYNWQLQEWPTFKYEEGQFQSFQKDYLFNAGKVGGLKTVLDKAENQQFTVDLLVNEAIKSAEIEGEMLSRVDLISSIKKNLGYPVKDHFIRDKRVEGFSKLLVQSREDFKKPLTEAMLFDWHNLLMKGTYGINAGQWRSHTEPMQIISGTLGKEKVHFVAPPSTQVAKEMKAFFEWFNSDLIKNPLIKSALAHLYFESIHPLEDGNGRIGRVIAEKALSQSMSHPVLLSLSGIIEADKANYYKQLKKAQKTLEVSDWIEWFCEVVIKAQRSFEDLITFSIKKARFFDKKQSELNTRQVKVIARMLEEGPHFEGGMTSKKYMSITKTSKATATRDLQGLLEKQVLTMEGGGRSTSYQVKV